MIVVGIDPSLSGTGVYSSSGASQEFSVKSLGQHPWQRSNRHRLLAERVCAFALGGEPADDVHVFVEGYSYGSKGSAVTNLSEYRGILYAEMMPLCGAITEVAPGTLKKFACGKGSADKVAVATALTQRYGLAFASDNLADAYALMRIGLCVVGVDDATNDAQRQAVATVLKGQAA